MTSPIEESTKNHHASAESSLLEHGTNSVLAKTSQELSQVGSLLDKDIPSYRQAYSDRTSWIMACLSELAYIKFNPLFSSAEKKDYFVRQVAALVDDNRQKSLLKLVDMLSYDMEEERARLNGELSLLRMTLEESYDVDGTQAILVSNDKFVTLAFRGTEANSIKDIKADAKANTTACQSGGKVHSGFNRAFECVMHDIQQTLDRGNYKHKPLFITGHSLGGALATIAAKRLSHQGGIAACYTFGSPRVGDEEWIADIKAPVHRLVNSADCVTMLPPGVEATTVISWLVQFVPVFGHKLKVMLLSKLGGYLHVGNMRYLTDCEPGKYDEVKLLYSVSIWRRLKALFIKELPVKMFLADHSISVYRKKLKVIAIRRNS